MKLIGFTNSNFQSNYDDNKSMSDFMFILNGGVICWKSFKQHTMADLVCEVEYIAAFDVAKKAVWLQKFISELEVAPSLDGPILLYYNSTGTIDQAKKLKFHQHTKHILHPYHLVWEIVDRDDVNLQKIDRKKNLADLFTKALSVKEFKDHKIKMDIRYCTDWP